MYTREEVIESALEYFQGDDLAANIWTDKYCLKDRLGNYLELTPDDMHHRLAKEFARIEQNYLNSIPEEEIYQLFKNFKYLIPQGSPMFGVGNNHSITSLSNCFVIGSNDNSDSYGSIMRTDEEQVQLMKRRGGVGHDISHLRPSGAMANNSVLKGMSGSTLYMERFSNSTREVSQGDRRGALMLSIDVRHPDVDKFIDIKLEQGKVTGANISVKITNDFMEAVINDSDFYQTFPCKRTFVMSGISYNELIDCSEWKENDGTKYIKRINARELWNKIIKNAHQSAEPGILFWDQFKSESPSEGYKGHEIVGVNPCAELSLPAYDSCRLLAINLYSYVINPFTKEAYFDFKLFKEHVNKAQRLMDDLVDLEIEKLDKIIFKIKNDKESEDIKKVEFNLWKKIKSVTLEARRTGLGITAEGDMLAALGMRYGSDVAINFSEDVHKQMATESYKSSIQLAKERGAFPIWDFKKEQHNPFLNRVIKEGQEEYSKLYFDDYFEYGRRNIANLTIAPTGTTSLMTQTTSGIEPVFLPYYERSRKVDGVDKSKIHFIDSKGDYWEKFLVFHPKFIEWFKINLWYTSAIVTTAKSPKEFLETCQKDILETIFKSSPYYKSTANDIDWEKKVEMQGKIQKWIDHSISVTTNLPNSATVEDVNKIYMKAWKEGCKGITVYRDGCRDGVLNAIDSKKPETNEFHYNDSFKRPEVLECDIYRKTALKQNWLVLVGKADGLPYEIFGIKDVENHLFPFKIEKGIITKVKSKVYKLTGILDGKQYEIENIVKLMSDDERMDTRRYSSMLRHGMHPKYIRKQIEEFASIVSFDKVVYRVLGNYCKDEENTKKEKCPQCGVGELIMSEGCMKCNNCGYSKCG